MVDRLTKEQRSKVMSRIRSKDTHPEMVVRHGLHASGFRYSLHSAKLPGHPDLVLPKYHAAIWINGCYWHGHNCGAARLPSTNQSYWSPKIARTQERDRKHREALDALGWRSLTVWECALRGKHRRGAEAVVAEIEQWILAGAASCEIAGDSIFPRPCYGLKGRGP